MNEKIKCSSCLHGMQRIIDNATYCGKVEKIVENVIECVDYEVCK